MRGRAETLARPLIYSTGSFDPDPDDTLTFEWDFDYDGITFDIDASGATPCLMRPIWTDLAIARWRSG